VTAIGTPEHPLRVGIIGSGPAGFYAAEHLLKQQDRTIFVDMFDRLPTPFGLVRGGVAPDHQKIKSVTKVYDKIAAHPRFRFFGYVEIGKDMSVDDLKRFYHQIVFSVGAQTDKRLGIPGEDLSGSHPATEFVAWYNGHPDYRDLHFDLTQERVAVIGVGNVAIDVARILSLSVKELAQTDIAEHALEALSQSRVQEVYLIGRRGPVQAAFTTPEIKEVGEMEEADCITYADEVALDEFSAEELKASGDRALQQKVELLQKYAERGATGKRRKLIIRFLWSPLEILGEAGRVTGLKMVKNELYKTEVGTILARQTERIETLDCGLVFRSIGYRGVPLDGVPFHEKWGIINNQEGRVFDPQNGTVVTGYYTAGWIKRGPSGVIGTNRPDSVETAQAMLEDCAKGAVNLPSQPDPAAVLDFLRVCQPRFVTYEDWQKLDALEQARGAELGRPRLKFTRIEEMLAVLGK